MNNSPTDNQNIMQLQALAHEVCRSHSARPDRDLYRICPTKLSKRELEDLYFALLESNLELKRTINSQNDKLKMLSTKVQRLSATKTSGIKDKDCCNSKTIINEHKDSITELRKCNERMAERIRVLNMRLCSAKQFLKKQPTEQKNINKNQSKNVTSFQRFKNVCDNQTKPHQPAIEYKISKSVGTSTENPMVTASPIEENTHECNENKCRTAIEELEQKIRELQEELQLTQHNNASKLHNLENEIRSVMDENVRARADSRALEEKGDDLVSKLRAAEGRGDDLETQLAIEKRKVKELETRLKLADSDKNLAKSLDQLRVINEKRDSDASAPPAYKIRPRQSVSRDPKSSSEVNLPKTDDSGYIDPNKSFDVEPEKDEEMLRINRELLKKIADLKTQLDLLIIAAAGTKQDEPTEAQYKPAAGGTKLTEYYTVPSKRSSTLTAEVPNIIEPNQLVEAKTEDKCKEAPSSVKQEVAQNAGQIPILLPTEDQGFSYKNSPHNFIASNNLQPPSLEQKKSVANEKSPILYEDRIEQSISNEIRVPRSSVYPEPKASQNIQEVKLKSKEESEGRDALSSSYEDKVPMSKPFQQTIPTSSTRIHESPLLDGIPLSSFEDNAPTTSSPYEEKMKRLHDEKLHSEDDTKSIRFESYIHMAESSNKEYGPKLAKHEEPFEDDLTIPSKAKRKSGSTIGTSKSDDHNGFQIPGPIPSTPKPIPKDRKKHRYSFDKTKKGFSEEKFGTIFDNDKAQLRQSIHMDKNESSSTQYLDDAKKEHNQAPVDLPRRDSATYTQTDKQPQTYTIPKDASTQPKRETVDQTTYTQNETHKYPKAYKRDTYTNNYYPQVGPQNEQTQRYSRSTSPDNTEKEISSLPDLPQEKDTKPTQGYLSPGEKATMTFTDNETNTDYGSLSEGELPSTRKATKSVGKKSRSEESPTQRMEDVLQSISVELARCHRLLASQKCEERKGNKPVDDHGVQLRASQGARRLSGTHHVCVFTLHIGTLVLSDEAVFQSRDKSLVLTWRFYDSSVTMTRIRAGRVVLFDFSTEYDVVFSEDFINYMKYEKMPLLVCEINKQDRPFATCSLPLRDVLLHVNRRADMSLTLTSGLSGDSELSSSEELGVLDLWCILRCDAVITQHLVKTMARSSVANMSPRRSYNRSMIEEELSYELSEDLDLNIKKENRAPNNFYNQLPMNNKKSFSGYLPNALDGASQPADQFTAADHNVKQEETWKMPKVEDKLLPRKNRLSNLKFTKKLSEGGTIDSVQHLRSKRTSDRKSSQPKYELPIDRSENDLSKKYNDISKLMVSRMDAAKKSVKYYSDEDEQPQRSVQQDDPSPQSIEITVLWLALNEECDAMVNPDIKRLYVAYKFLGRNGAELETPVSLPKPKHYVDKCFFNFKKTFHLHDADLPALGRMTRVRAGSRVSTDPRDCLVFTVISEPPEDPLGLANCEDVGYAYLYLGDILAYSSGSGAYTEVVAVHAARGSAVCGVLAVKIDGLHVLRRALTLSYSSKDFSMAC